MNTGQQLRDLLAPLGVYRWEGSFQWGELQSEGAALEGVAQELGTLQREMSLATAEAEGLEQVAELLPCRPVSDQPETLRQALAALLRVGGGSSTLAAVNDTLQGCGVPAVVTETSSPLQVIVTFPAAYDVPDQFQRLEAIVERILPCHLLIEYQFRGISWEELEARYATWEELERAGVSWRGLEEQTDPA